MAMTEAYQTKLFALGAKVLEYNNNAPDEKELTLFFRKKYFRIFHEENNVMIPLAGEVPHIENRGTPGIYDDEATLDAVSAIVDTMIAGLSA